MTTAHPDTLDIVGSGGSHRLSSFSRRARILGKGGAGSVYAHPDLPGQAIKLYATAERAKAHEAKVGAMLLATPRDVRTRFGTVQIAWPSAAVIGGNRFLGFVMPQIDFAEAWTLQQLVQPTQRARRGIPERMELRLYAARNLASVLQSLHDVGHYVIDLKPQNVLVYRHTAGRSAAHVALVDCDGFQVRDPHGRRFDAELATPQFLHPDVMVRAGDEVSFDLRRINERAEIQDDFALAVILFQLLNDGLHPMSGRVTGGAQVPTELAERLQGRGDYYAYGRGRQNPLVRADDDSLHGWFDKDLRKLFDRAFAGGRPPPVAQEWKRVLDRLSNERRQRCRVDEKHWKLGRRCGQCARDGRTEDKARQPAPGPSQASLPSRPGRTVPASRVALPALVRRPRVRMVPIGLLALVAAGGGWIAAEGFRTNPSSDGAVPIGLDAQAARFARTYFSQSDSNAHALDFARRVYQAPVRYFGKSVGVDAVIADKRRTIERWPQRSYVIRRGSVTTRCSNRICDITGTVDWTVHSDERAATNSGTADFHISADLSGITPRIRAEDGHVVRR